MSEINADTVITLTMKQLLGAYVGALVVLGGTIWTVSTFALGNLKQDVADIRTAVTEAQDRNADTLQTTTTADGALRAQIADLTAELKVTNAGLSNLSSSVGGLDKSMQAVDQRLADSVARQEKFESWVVTRLGTGAGVEPTAVPPEWLKQQGDIITKIKSGDDPLTRWFQAVEMPLKK